MLEPGMHLTQVRGVCARRHPKLDVCIGVLARSSKAHRSTTREFRYLAGALPQRRAKAGSARRNKNFLAGSSLAHLITAKRRDG
jgi:hypothetical protein